jgi:hypothetical protein
LEEVEDAFKTLHEENLLKPMTIYNHKIIYEIPDNSLERLLEDCLELYDFVYGTIYGIWRFIRGPTDDEIEWLELFKGEKDTSRIKKSAYDERHTRRKKKNKEWLKWYKGDVRDSQKYINGNISELEKKHADTIKRYRFPSEDILEIIYPSKIFTRDLFTS